MDFGRDIVQQVTLALFANMQNKIHTLFFPFYS